MKNNKRTLMCTVAVDMDNGSRDYIKQCKEMVDGYLEHTDFDVIVLTNQYDRMYSMFNSDRVWVAGIPKDMLSNCYRHNGFDELLKIYTIDLAYGFTNPNHTYDVIYYIDSDLVINGFDMDSYNRLINVDSVDLWTSIELAPVDILRYKRSTYGVFRGNNKPSIADIRGGEMVLVDENGYGIKCPQIHTLREDRLIYTNRAKMREMLDLYTQQGVWHEMLGEDTKAYRVIGTKEHNGYIGAVLGESAHMTNARVSMVDDAIWGFAKYEYVIDYTSTQHKLNRSWMAEESLDHTQAYIRNVNASNRSTYNKQYDMQ